MCGRYCSGRATAVFQNHLKWLHMAAPMIVAPVWGDTGHKDCRGDEKNPMCVVRNLTHRLFKSRTAEKEKCSASRFYLLSAVVSLQGCGLHVLECPWYNDREEERKTSCQTRLCSMLAFNHVSICPKRSKMQRQPLSFQLKSQYIIHLTKLDKKTKKSPWIMLYNVYHNWSPVQILRQHFIFLYFEVIWYFFRDTYCKISC